MWGLEPARYAHINHLAKRLRAIDIAECAAVGHTPKQALVTGLKGSTFALTVTRAGKPVAMLGVAPGSVMDGVGVPWLLGSDDLMKAGRLFLTWGPKIVAAMLGEWPSLQNYVGAENHRAIRVLKALRFDVEARTVVVGGMEMRRFSLRKS